MRVLARFSRGFLRGRWSPLRRTFGSFSDGRKGTRGARRNALVILAAHRRLRSGFRPAGPGRMATPYGESKGGLWPSLNARRRSAALAAGEERIYARAGRPRWSPLRRTFGSFSSVRKGTRAARRNALVILAALGRQFLSKPAGRSAANPKPPPGRDPAISAAASGTSGAPRRGVKKAPPGAARQIQNRPPGRKAQKRLRRSQSGSPNE